MALTRTGEKTKARNNPREVATLTLSPEEELRMRSKKQVTPIKTTVVRPIARQTARLICSAVTSGCLTVGRSAASRASEASGPSEGEGGESAATPC